MKLDRIKSRVCSNGMSRKLLKFSKHIIKEYPDSNYAKILLKQSRLKFWLGLHQISFFKIYNEAWHKLNINLNSKIIEIGGLKFINDNSLKREFTDIFIAGGFNISLIDIEIIIATKLLALLSVEGPYENENIKLKENDIVIDAGANMGLFSLFCMNKKVKKVYAFEPQKEVTKILKNNLSLNNALSQIEVIPLGLSDKNDEFILSHSPTGHEAGSIAILRNNENDTEVIRCVTLDSWAKENNINKIDFIKADIEGAERNMLLGATEILKEFSPSLAICTYHLPDDPSVLEKIIINANSKYKIQHTSHKLYAYVP